MIDPLKNEKDGFDWRWHPCPGCDGGEQCPCEDAVIVAYVGSVADQDLVSRLHQVSTCIPNGKYLSTESGLSTHHDTEV